VRVDYFLKVSRIVKRRPLAKEMCDKKLIAINGATVKSGKDVTVGDILTVQFPSRTVKVRIEQVPTRAVSKHDSASLYTLLEEVRRPEEEW
jgi:ribosomal 50S subunit-recycling heat shock protein